MSRSAKAGWRASILRSLAPDCDVEAMLGDLTEERASRRRRAPRSSHGPWYWGQVLRSTPELLWASVTGRGWPTTWGAACLLYVAAAAVQFASSAVLSKAMEAGNWLTAVNLI